VLKVGDLPPGWRTTEAPESSDDGFVNRPECKRARAAGKRSEKLPRAEASFVRGSNAELHNTVIVYPTSAAARKAFTPIEDPVVASCLDEGLEELFRKNLRTDPRMASQVDSLDVDVGQLSVALVGEDLAAYEAVITVGSDGFDLELYVDILYVLQGRVVTIVLGQDTFSRLTDVDEAVAVVVDRVIGI
jgi:hypothetical protein